MATMMTKSINSAERERTGCREDTRILRYLYLELECLICNFMNQMRIYFITMQRNLSSEFSFNLYAIQLTCVQKMTVFYFTWF